MTRISIVTVVYNSKNLLEGTIESVISQSYPDIEYIVIDGGSTDGTVDVIEVFQSSMTYWVSEPDYGIYDAMNKAIRVASGQWCLFLNAGDVLDTTDTIQQVVDSLDSRYTLCFGDYRINYGDGRYKLVRQKSLQSRLGEYKVICHQSIFYNLDKLGAEIFQYSNKYYLLSDFHFTLWSRSLDRQFHLKKISVIISQYLFGGISEVRKPKSLRERKEILKELPIHPVARLYNLLLLNLKLFKAKLI